MPRLAYVEHCLPGDDLGERLAFAREHNLALEVANGGSLDLEPILDAGFEVVSLQAYRMHQFHPLHPHRLRRDMARGHVEETIGIAARFGVPRIVTACGFGQELADRPFERSLEFFQSLAPVARDAGVRIMIEPLSPRKAAAMTDLDEMRRFLELLGSQDVFCTILDTGHLLDGGHDPTAVIARWPGRVEEVQLRGRGGQPPGPGDPLRQWMRAPRRPPAVIAVEHREPIDEEAFEVLMEELEKATG
jgi:sugar phosphate isomerase/epimerase